MVSITVTSEPDPPCLDSDQTSVKVTFEASASGGKCDSYKYKWSGAVSGTGESVSATFKKAGTYKATVKVTCGKETASDSASVIVKEEGEEGDLCQQAVYQAYASPSQSNAEDVCWACCGTYCLAATDYTLCFVTCYETCMAPFYGQ